MTEFVLVLLDSDVVSAVIHMDGTVLCSEPHGGLGYIHVKPSLQCKMKKSLTCGGLDLGSILR